MNALTSTERAELSNLYHLARTALSGQRTSTGEPRDTMYDRKLWAASELIKRHPHISHKQAYLAFERQ